VRCQREFWKIIYVESGSGLKVINSRKYPFKAGSIFLIHPEDNTTFIIDSEYIEIYNILFMPELIASAIGSLSDDFNFFSILHRSFHKEIPLEQRECLYVLESNTEIHRMVKNIEKESKAQLSNYRNAIIFKLLDLLIAVSRLGSKKLKKQRKSTVVHYVNHVIDTHYREDFDLEFLAEKVDLNKSYLCRLYRSTTGKTISHAIRDRRLAVAKAQLTNTRKTISEICYDCGFNDLSYFYRSFTANTGFNPGRYRKKFGLD
jgi:AraC-like DNA-binding protein